jgi:hypothetical protein
MATRRKALLTLGAAVSVAGCTDTSDTADSSETGESNESELQKETNNKETESDTNSTNSPATIEISSIDAANTAEMGSYLDVTTTVTTDSDTTVTVEITDQSGESVGEDSTEINATGEQTVTLSAIPATTSATGNGSVRVQATSGSVSKEVSTKVEIVAPPEGWEQPLENTKRSIEQFLEKYAAIGSESDDSTILDVTISDPYADNNDTSDLFDAEDHAREARDEATGNDNAIQKTRRIRDEIRFLKELDDLQQASSDIWPLLQTELEEFREGRDISGDIDPQYSTASDTHETVSTSLEELNPIVGSSYEQKLIQIEAELDIVDRMINAITAVFSAQNNLEQEFYGTAFDRAQSARRDFDLAVRDIEDETNYPPEDDIDEEFRDHAQEWKEEASRIEKEASNRETEENDNSY